MSALFEAKRKPEWILLVAGDDTGLRRQQLDELQQHVQELKERAIIVFEVSRTEVTALEQDCRCVAGSADVAKTYRLAFDRFTASLVDVNDSVKWVAPIPVCFADIVTTIEELPHREAENAARGPSLSG
ncbi:MULTISPECIES: DUF4174 domain-containing protein [Rhizobium]|uniref:DUF4174 domain-containing protein n=1 Tax=Rhizobium wenxiniae TaxID=1737357 RepID=A0A7X0D0K9_9HYPH|nr:DUF4174 domain-containing protein [Rhizobium wenxiniae]MBB6163479.1 hypothetical protein [Rhizobium wenxiniae]GGG08381.1 hypothetical protein GCM10010924_41630 [Rhizobium wenxiniae]